MGSLAYTTYVSPAKPVVSADVAPGETQQHWSPTSATLIYGSQDAVLVDALMTMDEGRALADWVGATGRNLTTIYITHGHGDHFFGATGVLERFPQARLVATPSVVERMREQVSPQMLDGFWRPRFPNQIADQPVVAQPLADHSVDLEGERLNAIELGHTDTDVTTALHVPSIALVVAGDAVYNDVHLYLNESGNGGSRQWIAGLDTIESLHPSAVIAGHKRDGADDDPDNIERTRRYLEDFYAAAQRTSKCLRAVRGDDRVLSGLDQPRRRVELRGSCQRLRSGGPSALGHAVADGQFIGAQGYRGVGDCEGHRGAGSVDDQEDLI